jgi:predicted AlkP superfamily pyrophosphatase or phosphodiesterase
VNDLYDMVNDTASIESMGRKMIAAIWKLLWEQYVLRRPMQAILITFLVLPLNLWSGESHPKLIVVVVVDQMRADYLSRFGAYETGGLHYFATQGANFVNANYQHWPTETCVGHAVLLSGRTPAHTGIVANAWYNRTARKIDYCLADADSPSVGDNGPALSPRNFLGDNFSDWLRDSYVNARIYSISLKDRGAITLAGHHPNGAYWFSSSGRFITSRYYAEKLPAWVEEFNQRKLADKYAGKPWSPLLSSDSAAYHTHTVAAHFPHVMPQKPSPELYESVFASPFGDEVLEAFAEATITANRLGQLAPETGPDVLTISFSSNDGVGHDYGPDSPEIADEQIRLDRTLGKLVDFLRGKVGEQNILWVLSGDHGAEPTPEAEQELNRNRSAERLPFSKAQAAMEEQLNKIFHITSEMHWFAAETGTMLYFDRDALQKHHISLEDARRVLATQVRNVPGVEGFYDPLQATTIPGWKGQFLRNSYFSGRSGDIYYLAKEWACFSEKPPGTTHSDPWPYDTHVPVVLAGWKIPPKKITASIEIADVAPTLASLLGVKVSPKEAIDGRSLQKLIGTFAREPGRSSTPASH